MAVSLESDSNLPYLKSLIRRGTKELDTAGAGSSYSEPSVSSGATPPRDAYTDIETWKIYQIPYHSAEIIGPRIISVKESRWTEITSDDSLVQKLLQMHFTFKYFLRIPAQ